MAFQTYRHVPKDIEYPPKGFGFVHHKDFPERYVRERDPRGWQVCDVCGNAFKLWMTNYQNWEKLPKAFRSGYFCVGCYRKLVDAAKRSDSEPEARTAMVALGKAMKALDKLDKSEGLRKTAWDRKLGR